MTIHKANLVVITVHKGPIQKLKNTLRSIDTQICAPYRNIVIAKNISLYQIANFKKKNRIFILNKDKSIYNAMNIGLRNTIRNDKFIIFLNSGDTFFDKKVIFHVKKYFMQNIPIVGRQILRYNKNFYSIRKYFANKNDYLPHGSFFCPPRAMHSASKSIKFDEKHKIDADGIWMKEVISACKNNFKKINTTVSVLELGGISTNPSASTALHYAKINFYSSIKEFIKFILRLTVGNNLYYKIIYFFKYKHVKKEI